MKNQQKQKASYLKITTLFGYSLFIAVTAGAIIPVASALMTLLNTPGVRHMYVIILFGSMGLATILPPLITYIVGCRATRSTVKYERRYNGVLLAIGSVWIPLLLTLINFSGSPLPSIPFIPSQLVNFLPPILGTLILVAVGLGYGRVSQNKSSLLQYKPYQVTLLISVAGVLAVSLWGTIRYLFDHIGPLRLDSWELVTSSTTIALLAILAVSYKLALFKSSWLERLASALIALSVASITFMAVGQLLAYSNLDISITTTITNLLGIGTWLLFLYLTLKKK